MQMRRVVPEWSGFDAPAHMVHLSSLPERLPGVDAPIGGVRVVLEPPLRHGTVVDQSLLEERRVNALGLRGQAGTQRVVGSRVVRYDRVDRIEDLPAGVHLAEEEAPTHPDVLFFYLPVRGRIACVEMQRLGER